MPCLLTDGCLSVGSCPVAYMCCTAVRDDNHRSARFRFAFLDRTSLREIARHEIRKPSSRLCKGLILLLAGFQGVSTKTTV